MKNKSRKQNYSSSVLPLMKRLMMPRPLSRMNVTMSSRSSVAANSSSIKLSACDGIHTFVIDDTVDIENMVDPFK